MSQKRILIVEDESIVALDIKKRLENMGYFVTGMVTKGEDAFAKASETEPDLVLMDIKLAGEIDGIRTAEHMREFFSLPIIFITAYSDDATLARAKITQPFGYIVKPIRDQDLHSNIEMSFYNHDMQLQLEENEQWLSAILNSIRDGVIATNDQLHVRLMNPVAEILTGWNEKAAVGKPINRVFNIINPEDKQPVFNLINDIFTTGNAQKNYLLVSHNGSQIPIWGKISVIKSGSGIVNGIVIVFDRI
ncbi:MAG: response regulator [Anaerolineales bacterium]|nr:response regulator [Chloroflexota bacterium]MBL6981802.1 response regulator [Anaerolineales bacterium]